MGDLVLRRVVGSAKNPAWEKLGPNWEGSYRITSVAGIGAYYLEDLKQLSSSWKNYMKELMEAILREDLYHTGPLHKATGGRRCRKTHWTM